QTVTVPTGSGTQRYGLGWWIEDRFGHRTVLSQGGNSGAQAWLRLIPSERVAAVVLVNKGVAFAGAAADSALAAVLPKYAEAMATAEATVKAQSNAPASSASATPPQLDSTIVGEWVGTIHAARGDVPVQFTIAPGGDTKVRVGTRTDSGAA